MVEYSPVKFKTIIGTVTLTAQRKSHIIQSHPIMASYLSNLKIVLETPEEIRYSSYSDDTLLFYRYFDKIEDGKYIAVVVSKIDMEIKTAYLTHRIKAERNYVQE